MAIGKLVVMEDIQGDGRLANPAATNKSDGHEVFRQANDLLDQTCRVRNRPSAAGEMKVDPSPGSLSRRAMDVLKWTEDRVERAGGHRISIIGHLALIIATRRWLLAAGDRSFPNAQKHIRGIKI